MAARCALELQQRDLAYNYAVEGTKFAAATPNLLRIRLLLEISKKDAASAVPSLERLARQYHQEINDIPIRWFFELDRELKTADDGTARRRVLAILSNPAYVPSEIGFTGDYFRRDYAVMLAASGAKGDAAGLLGRITDPLILIRISLDARLRDMMPADFDARVAVEADLRRLQELATRHPESVNVILAISKDLRILGRDDEALSLLEAARPDGPKGSVLIDLNRNTNWWWDAMAQVYSAMGRYEDAVAAFQSGVAATEGGSTNVSQLFNLAELQLHFGRNEEARRNIDTFDAASGSASAYGLMVYHLNHGCAHFLTGDHAGAKADVEYERAHERDSPRLLTELLLCTGDTREAGAAMVRRLDDPEQRVDALLELSDFDARPHPVTTDPTDAGLAKLKSLPDVIAAIARAGGTRRFRIQPVDT